MHQSLIELERRAVSEDNSRLAFQAFLERKRQNCLDLSYKNDLLVACGHRSQEEKSMDLLCFCEECDPEGGHDEDIVTVNKTLMFEVSARPGRVIAHLKWDGLILSNLVSILITKSNCGFFLKGERTLSFGPRMGIYQQKKREKKSLDMS